MKFKNVIYHSTLLVVVSLFYSSGCIPVRYEHPVKVDELPNTFATWQCNSRYIVQNVEVHQISGNAPSATDQPNRVVWQIAPTCEVHAKSFSVTVGRVPDGFKQLIPVPPEIFVPVPCQKYEIDIYPQRGGPIIYREWTAEPCNKDEK